MSSIHATQIKAARAILDWSQEDLAMAAGLSVGTVRHLEMGYISRRSSMAIKQAVEGAGLEFIEREGVRRQTDEIRVFQGADGGEALWEDLVQTIRTKGGGIAVNAISRKMLEQAWQGENPNSPSPLAKISDLADVKCLLSEPPETVFSGPRFQLRIISRPFAGPVPYLIYGDIGQKVIDLLNSPVGNGSFEAIRP